MTTDFPKKAEGVSPPTNEAAALENIPARGIRNRPVVVKPIAGLKPYDRNARTHSAEQIDQIIASISEWGWTNPVLIDEAGMILAGHGRVMAAEKMGLSEVPCITIDGLTDTQKRAYVLADNKLALNAGWDEEVLNAELKALADLQFDLGTVGFDMAEVRFLARLDATGDPEAVPEPPAEPVTKPGDVWLLGPHRLTCGDSTNAADVARALDGAKPHLMVTDPPYGVEYDAEFRNGMLRANGTVFGARAVGKVLNDDRADWREAWALFPGDVAYVWHASLKTAEVLASLEASGFEHRAQIIWDKGQIAIGRGHYHWRHEPAWYVVRGGASGRWQGSRKESTVWDIPKPQKSETGHSTQKPVECMARPIRNNSKPGDLVYDPFLGSGTTIIAAEQEGRVCYGLELSPAYCDVIVARWEAFTGRKAELQRAQVEAA
jgi:DNA modification methylase